MAEDGGDDDDDDTSSRASLLSRNQSLAQLASDFLEEVIEVDSDSHSL